MARLIEEEVWAYRPKILTGAAQLVLMRLADSAGKDHRMVWIGEKTLVNDTRKDRSTVFDALYQLRALNIVTDVPEQDWPREARCYPTVVRKINPVADWAVIFHDGGDIVQDTSASLEEWRTRSRRKQPVESTDDLIDKGHDTNGAPEGKVLSVQDYLGMIDAARSTWLAPENPTPEPDPAPESSESENPIESVGKSDPNQIPNQELKEEETSSLRPRLRAATAKAPRRTTRKPADDDGLDPADGLFDLDDTAKTERRTRRAPGPDTGLGLVDYFRKALGASAAGRKALAVPDAINHSAMAQTLNRWKSAGTTPDQIRAWMITYADETVKFRAPTAPVWKSFLASRAQIASQSAQQSEHDEKVNRHDRNHPDFAAYWGVSADDLALWEAA